MFKKHLAKKYYTASEIAKILNILPHQLRYLETNILNLSHYKIKNRKYYTNDDIKHLKDHIANNRKTSIKPNSVYLSHKIDMLIKNFNILSADITKFLGSVHFSN